MISLNINLATSHSHLKLCIDSPLPTGSSPSFLEWHAQPPVIWLQLPPAVPSLTNPYLASHTSTTKKSLQSLWAVLFLASVPLFIMSPLPRWSFHSFTCTWLSPTTLSGLVHGSLPLGSLSWQAARHSPQTLDWVGRTAPVLSHPPVHCTEDVSMHLSIDVSVSQSDCELFEAWDCAIFLYVPFCLAVA